MLKFIANAPETRIFGFGLTETDLDRLESNQLISFNFDHIQRPDLIGVLAYIPGWPDPEFASRMIESPAVVDTFKKECFRLLNLDKSVMPEHIFTFPICQSIFRSFRERPFWGFDCGVAITDPQDRQIFFAAKSEEDIKEYMESLLS